MRPTANRVSATTVPRRILLPHSLCILASLLACGGGASPDEPVAEKAIRGGVLRLVQEAPRSLDPLVGDSVYESLPVNQVFDTLVDFDTSLNPVPGLAETWRISQDGIHYSFQLREGVRFHDGRDVTAGDVRFTLLRNLAPDAPSRSLAYTSLLAIEGAREFTAGERADVPGLRVVDPRTIEIHLSRPYVSFLEVLAMDALSVVPEHVVREIGNEAFGRGPVGTGPFRFEDWNENRLRLVNAGDHFRGAPLLDAVEIAFLGDEEDDYGEARFFAGEVDLLEPSSESLSRLEADPTVRMRHYQELSLTFFGLNARQPPLDRPWIREAIARSIDRDALIAASPAVRREAAGILPPGLPGYSPELKSLPYDPDRAAALLSRHGHTGGAGLPPVRIAMPSMGPAALQVLETIRSGLEEIGLRLEVVPVTWLELSEQLEEGTAPTFLLGWVADRTDPDAFLRSLFAERGSANYFGYANAEVEKLLDQGTMERNPQQRTRVYRDLERKILADAPIVPLYHTVGVIASRGHVCGFEPTPLGMAKTDLRGVWLDEEGPES